MNAMTQDLIADRVAQRHAREAAVVLGNMPAAPTRIEYTDSGRISDIAVMTLLESAVGKLMKLRFRRSLVVDPNGVEWEGIDENANIVSGRLTLHAAISETEIVSWAEVVVDHRRADPIARRVAVEYQRRGEGLVPAGDDDEEGNEQVDDEAEQVSQTVLVDPDDLRLIEPADPITRRIAGEYARRERGSCPWTGRSRFVTMEKAAHLGLRGRVSPRPNAPHISG
jgi:hypothetical protein